LEFPVCAEPGVPDENTEGELWVGVELWAGVAAGDVVWAVLDGELLWAALLETALEEDAAPRPSARSVAAMTAIAVLAINNSAIRTLGRRMKTSFRFGV
jgi:hypothetical protein